MLDNRKIGELPEINGKLVKVRREQGGPVVAAARVWWVWGFSLSPEPGLAGAAGLQPGVKPEAVAGRLVVGKEKLLSQGLSGLSFVLWLLRGALGPA